MGGLTSFIVGMILGFVDDGAYMASVSESTKGRPLSAMFFYAIFFVATMAAVLFVVQENWIGVGGMAGVGLVALKNKREAEG